MQRYIGIDLSKKSMQIVILVGKKIIRKKYSTNNDGQLAFSKLVQKDDIIALEAGNNSFNLARFLEKERGCRVHVLNAGKLHIIFRSHKKTDKEDALRLAKFIQRTPEDELPIVPLPTEDEVNLRKLTAENERIVKFINQAKNVLHSLFWDAGINDLTKADMSKKQTRESSINRLPANQQHRAKRLLAQIELFEDQLKDIEKEQKEELRNHQDETLISMSMPGVGIKVAVAILAYMGKMERFDNQKQAANYSGFTPTIDQSGQVSYTRGISKNGSKVLRKMMNQAAWTAVREGQNNTMRDMFLRLSEKKGKKKAIVAVSRKMITILYSLHKNKQLFKRADGSEHEYTLKKMTNYGIIRKTDLIKK